MNEAILRDGWDGEWFVRAYDAFGHKIGSKECEDGKIYIESQGYCVMGGVGVKDGKAEKALESVHKYLETKHGIVLLQPAYKEYHLELGEVSSYPPGYKENAGIFCHNNPWIIAAETVVGHGDRAFDLYSRIAPAYREEISDLHKMEPYVYSQMIAGKDAKNFGQAKNSWLTGTAAWNFYVISNYILGIKPDWEGLKVDPCIPHTWDAYQVSRRFRGATYAIAIENPFRVTAVLRDKGKICWSQDMKMQYSDKGTSNILQVTGALKDTLPISITPWDHHKPYLYDFCLEVRDQDNCLIEIVPYAIGFRRLEIIDKVIYLNGKRLILTGINRHEWEPHKGRCITEKEMRIDLMLFQQNHINAVRTCHYPNQIPWYYMCDEAGIYMMAETNLESHGSWQKMGAIEPSYNVPGSIPQWKEAVIDRAQSNYETFKNHTSILFWSLGNESYAGDDIEAMNQYFMDQNDGRLIHYEGVSVNRSYEDKISQVESRMYATPDEVRQYLDQNAKKPYVLCEYMHCMGNSLGGMDSYMNLLDKYPMFQGGFIWDYIDQAIYVKDEVTGEQVLRYGGDFDDRPSDYEFSGNGIVFADRTEKPATQEVKYYYAKYE